MWVGDLFLYLLFGSGIKFWRLVTGVDIKWNLEVIQVCSLDSMYVAREVEHGIMCA